MKEFEKTFDNAVLDYDASRPMYAKELYDDILTYHPIDEKSKVLEIGIGTGKATKPLLDTGAEVIAIEPGEQLAAFAKERFSQYRNITLLNMTLQEYECLGDSFDLVYAATAFHWIPEDYGYPKVYELLKNDLYEDAYERQLAEPQKYKGKNIAEGMENLLFICPECGEKL